MVDKVSSAELRAKLDPSGFQQGAKQVETSAVSMTAAVDKLSVATEKAGKNAAVSANGFQQFLAKLDPGVRMGQEYARTMDQLDRYQKAGVVSATDLAVAHDAIRAKFQGSSQAVNELGGMFGFAEEAAAPFMALLSAAPLVEFGKRVFENAAALDAAADRTGLSTEALQVYRAELKLAGIASDEADTMLARFTKTLGMAQLGAGKERDELVKLGLTARDIAGDPGAALPLVAKGLVDVADKASRAAEVTEIFGRSGQKMDIILQSLSRGYAENAAEAKRLGLVMSDDVADQAHEAAEKFEEAWNRIEVSFTPVATGIASGLATIVEALENWHPIINIRANLGLQGPDAGNKPGNGGAPTATYSRFGYWGGGGNDRSSDGTPRDRDNAFPSTKSDEWFADMNRRIDMQHLSTTERAAEQAVIDLVNKKLEEGNRTGADGLKITAAHVEDYKLSATFLGPVLTAEARRLGILLDQGKELKAHNAELERGARILEGQTRTLSDNDNSVAQLNERVAGLLPGGTSRDSFIGKSLERVRTPQNLNLGSMGDMGLYAQFMHQMASTAQGAGKEYDLGLYNKSLSLPQDGATAGQARIKELTDELAATRRLTVEFPEHAAEFNGAIVNIQNALRLATIAADPFKLQLDQLATSLAGDVSHGTESAVFSGNLGKAGKETLLSGAHDVYKTMIGDPLEKGLKSTFDNLLGLGGAAGKPDGSAANPLHVTMSGLGAFGSSTSLGGHTGSGGGFAGILDSLFSSSRSGAGIAEAGKGAASSGWLSSLDSLFAGLFDDGGTIGPGQWGVKSGKPEIIQGGTHGVSVAPLYSAPDASSGGGHTVNITVNAPGATPGMENFIAQKAAVATHLAMQAYMPLMVSAGRQSALNRLNAINGTNFK